MHAMWGGKYAQHPEPQYSKLREPPRDAGYYGAVPVNEVTDMGFLGGERGSEATFVTEDTTRIEPARDFWVVRNYAFHNDAAVSIKAAGQRYGDVRHVGPSRANGTSLRVQRQPEVTMPDLRVPSAFMAGGVGPRHTVSTKLFRPIQGGSELPEAPSRPALPVRTVRMDKDRGWEPRQRVIPVFADANLAPPARPGFADRDTEETTLSL
jgi:hypothetical protein